MTINARGATPDSAGHSEVFGGQGRTGRRVADLVVLLTPPLLLVVPALLIRARSIDDGYLFLNLASLGISALVAAYAQMGWHARPHDGDLLSARTLSGRRTVDLARLTKVGRLEVPGQARTDDRLILTDAHGVRLILDKLAGGDETVDALVRRALLSRPPGAGVVVSDRAAERLDLSTEVRRPHGRLKAGRTVREGVIGWIPILSVVVFAPVSFGLLVAGFLLSGVD
ncbi:hypothetical protein [Streptomyces sp. BA2]|uniref:hypothetical protein n=1 Tax=Streptomyces sp. BA2 TaxID=436595 RepID=UPI00132C662D|nr:hypothetical protein [Streptomyces sp. BA2]MWA15213.1 hypothetical protein [Streptomyces sp. BA2]